MIAVGLWGAQLRAPAIWLLPVAFPMVMALGGLAALLGMPLPGVEIGIALSAIALGALVAFQVRLPLAAALAWCRCSRCSTATRTAPSSRRARTPSPTAWDSSSPPACCTPPASPSACCTRCPAGAWRCAAPARSSVAPACFPRAGGRMKGSSARCSSPRALPAAGPPRHDRRRAVLRRRCALLRVVRGGAAGARAGAARRPARRALRPLADRRAAAGLAARRALAPGLAFLSPLAVTAALIVPGALAAWDRRCRCGA